MLKKIAMLLVIISAFYPRSTAFGDVKASVIHGIPGAIVDVYVNGGLFLPNFSFGTVTGQVSLSPGVYDIKVYPAGSDPNSSIPILSLMASLSDGQNVSLVAHLNGNGGLALTPFFNDVAAIDNQSGLPPAATASSRLFVRHVALAPTVSVVANGKSLFTLSNGTEAGSDIRTHGYAAWLALPGTKKPVFGPVNLKPQSGNLSVVYAVGSIQDGSFTVLTQSIPLSQ